MKLEHLYEFVQVVDDIQMSVAGQVDARGAARRHVQLQHCQEESLWSKHLWGVLRTLSTRGGYYS